jgi:hypothetical protein
MPEYLPAPVTSTRDPIGRTRGSAAMVVPAMGLEPSEVIRLLVYAKARNFFAFARIERSECLCWSPSAVAPGDSVRLSATSS